MLFSLIRPAKECTDSGVLTEAVEKNSSGLSDCSPKNDSWCLLVLKYGNTKRIIGMSAGYPVG
jgi:hypothetical protein